MSSNMNSTSSLTDSTSNPTDGSGRTFISPYSVQFGSVPPIFNPDGSIHGIYDLEGNFYVSNPDRTSRISVPGLGASPTLVNASSSRVPPPSSMGNMASGGSMSRALSSDGRIPSQGSRLGSTEQSRMMSGVVQQQGSPQVYSMPGSSYPIAGGHSQTQVQAMNNLSSMNDVNSYFTRQFQPGAPMKQGLGLSPMYQLNQESNIQKEDFPPLPGYTGSNAVYPMDLQQKEPMMQSQQSYTGGSSSIASRPVNAAMGYGQPLQHHQNTSQYRGQKLPAIGQPIRDVRSEPVQETSQSNPDPFRMLALLNVINNTNPDATTLAIGVDLTAMGLDMTSKEDLFKTFASPWANKPLTDGLEFTLPECYNVPRPPPHKWMFRHFELETLFYIFYSMPKDEAQLNAADELYNKGWFYHKEHKCWFLRIGEPLVKTNAYERGTYDFFDPEKFECVRKENVFIYYEMLEKRSSLPQHRV